MNGLTEEQREAAEHIVAATRFENLSDAGNARRFVTQHGHKVKFASEAGHHLIYTGAFWSKDLTDEVMRMGKATARSILTEATHEEDGATRSKIARWALASENESRLRAMISLARSEPGIPVLQSDLDANPDLFQTANATIDLTTGEARKPKPDDLITRHSEVKFDHTATCPRWERFQHEIFDGDAELVEWNQRWIGYTLTGHTDEHAMKLAHGPKGRGGKSVEAEIVKRLHGSNAVHAAFDTFTRKRGDSAPRNDIARLAGARLVISSESQADRRLDEAAIKSMTGGDTITARFLYGEHFEFRPNFKIWLISNHRPRVDGGDEAIWARIREVPYMVSFKGREDRHLESTLAAELPGILNWAIEGALKWRKDGLGTAQAIERSTAEYRQEEDTLGAFLADACEFDGEVLTTDLRAAYDRWCEVNGEKSMPANRFGRELATRGITRGGAGRRFYRGVNLR